MVDMGERLLAQQGCLKALREVISAKMELSYDEWKFMEDYLGALKRVVAVKQVWLGWTGQSDESTQVGWYRRRWWDRRRRHRSVVLMVTDF